MISITITMLIKTHSSLRMFFLSPERPMCKHIKRTKMCIRPYSNSKLCVTSMMHFNHWAVPVDCIRTVLIFTQITMVWLSIYNILWDIKFLAFYVFNYPQRYSCIKKWTNTFLICFEAILKLLYKPNILDNYDTHFLSNRHSFCTNCNTERKCLCYNFFQALEKENRLQMLNAFSFNKKANICIKCCWCLMKIAAWI